MTQKTNPTPITQTSSPTTLSRSLLYRPRKLEKRKLHKIKKKKKGKVWLESRKREEGEIFRIIGRDPDSTRRSFCPPSRIVASEIRERFGGSNALKGGRRERRVRVSGLVRRQKLAGRRREGEGERGYGGASTWRKLGESCRRQWRRESVLRKKARRVEQRIFDENGVHGKPLKGDEWKKREWTWSPLASSLFFSRDASVSLSSPLGKSSIEGKVGQRGTNETIRTQDRAEGGRREERWWSTRRFDEEEVRLGRGWCFLSVQGWPFEDFCLILRCLLGRKSV